MAYPWNYQGTQYNAHCYQRNTGVRLDESYKVHREGCNFCSGFGATKIASSVNTTK